MEPIRFDDRVAVITGGGGGIGRTYALELARRGCKVVVNDFGGSRDGSGAGHNMADAVVEEIRRHGGVAAASYESVTTPEGGKAVIDAALQGFGRLDILIHNAGILRDRSFAKMSAEDWHTVLAVHLHGAFHVAQPAFVAMKERRYGRMLFTTSVSGLFGSFGQANYAAAKMGQAGLVNVLAIEGRKYGIQVNALSPLALTRMTEDLDRTGMPDVAREPEHVTPAAVYLVAEVCQTTGQIVQAGHGFYGGVRIAFNPGVFLGRDPAGVEQVAEVWDTITTAQTLQVETPQRRYMQHIYAKAGV